METIFIEALLFLSHLIGVVPTPPDSNGWEILTNWQPSQSGYEFSAKLKK